MFGLLKLDFLFCKKMGRWRAPKREGG